eukprot:1156319-Pelagomonas_calceolata.AAC.11
MPGGSRVRPGMDSRPMMGALPPRGSEGPAASMHMCVCVYVCVCVCVLVNKQKYAQIHPGVHGEHCHVPRWYAANVWSILIVTCTHTLISPVLPKHVIYNTLVAQGQTRLHVHSMLDVLDASIEILTCSTHRQRAPTAAFFGVLQTEVLQMYLKTDLGSLADSQKRMHATKPDHLNLKNFGRREDFCSILQSACVAQMIHEQPCAPMSFTTCALLDMVWLRGGEASVLEREAFSLAVECAPAAMVGSPALKHSIHG